VSLIVARASCPWSKRIESGTETASTFFLGCMSEFYSPFQVFGLIRAATVRERTNRRGKFFLAAAEPCPLPCMIDLRRKTQESKRVAVVFLFATFSFSGMCISPGVSGRRKTSLPWASSPSVRLSSPPGITGQSRTGPCLGKRIGLQGWEARNLGIIPLFQERFQ
jgi:hypothetical protein